MPIELSAKVRKLLDEPNFAHLATLMPDGSPQVSPVWVALEGGRIVVNTAEGRAKARNMRRDPRVAISITDRNNPYESACIRGRVVAEAHDGADESIDRLAKKYLGQAKYPFRQPGERRVMFFIEPEHVVA